MKKRECLCAEGEKLTRKVLVFTCGARAGVCFGSVGRESLCLDARRKKYLCFFSAGRGDFLSTAHSLFFQFFRQQPSSLVR